MNKVILMGRLTRDPDVRYSAGSADVTVKRPLILSVALPLAAVQNLQRSIFIRD